MTMNSTARLIFDFEHRCAIIDGVTKNTMFPDQVVDRLEISMTGRWFRIFGSDAEIKKIDCVKNANKCFQVARYVHTQVNKCCLR